MLYYALNPKFLQLIFHRKKQLHMRLHLSYL